MSDYTPTGNPIAITRAASSDIRNEFSAIATAITSKSNKAGQAYTGAHDFTGATISVPTPTTATAAATKAYVDALSVAAGNVPPGGAAGQALIKNSSTNYDMSWGQAGAGMGGTTATGNVTLTASSPAAMTITPATPGLYITLPDATTCTKADNLFAIYNAGDYDYGVKDSTGTQLGWVRARTGAMIGLSDSSTAAGVWAYYGLEKTGVTASYTSPTLSPLGALGSPAILRIALDANRTCYLFGGTEVYAIVYDASSLTWGSATLVRSGITAGIFSGILSTTNQVLVCTSNGTSFEAVTLTISGTGVTVNTGTKATKTLSAAPTVASAMIAVGSSFVVAYVQNSTDFAYIGITVSGTTPTLGTEVNQTGNQTTIPPLLFASGSMLRTVVVSGSSTVVCTPYTVSGTTLTVGTAATVTTTTSTAVRAFVNGNGNIVCHYVNSTHYAAIFKLTSTTEAASTVDLGGIPSINAKISADYIQVSAGKTVFVVAANPSPSKANILTDTAGTASAGTAISIYAGLSINVAAGISLSGTTAHFALAGTSNDSRSEIHNILLDCSGSSPVLTQQTRLLTYSESGSGGYAQARSYALPYASDVYGVRYLGNFITGQTLRTVGGGLAAYDAVLTPNSIQAAKATIVNAGNNALYQYLPYGVVASATETMFMSTYSSTVGVSLQRVEAAA